MKFLKFFFPVVIFFSSCKETIKQNEHTTYNSLYIFDSIIFQDNIFYPGITITDFNRRKNILLGFDWSSKEIILVNTKSKDIKVFNKFGNGPGEYNDIRGLSFFNDSTFFVLSLSDVIFYNLNGIHKITKSIKFANIFQGHNLFKFNIPFKFNDKNDTIIFLRHFNNNLERGKYEKIYWLTELNLTDKSFRKVFNLDKKNPLFSLGDYRFDRSVPLYSNVINDSLIYFMYPFSTEIICRNVNNYNVINNKSVNFDINGFKGLKYKKTSESSKSFEISQKTDYCVNFFINNYKCFLVYSKGIPESYAVKTRAEYVGKNIEERYRKNFLAVKNILDKKQDLYSLRNNRSKFRLLYVVSEDEIFLLKHNFSNEESIFKIYIARTTNK